MYGAADQQSASAPMYDTAGQQLAGAPLYETAGRLSASAPMYDAAGQLSASAPMYDTAGQLLSSKPVYDTAGQHSTDTQMYDVAVSGGIGSQSTATRQPLYDAGAAGTLQPKPHYVPGSQGLPKAELAGAQVYDVGSSGYLNAQTLIRTPPQAGAQQADYDVATTGETNYDVAAASGPSRTMSYHEVLDGAKAGGLAVYDSATGDGFDGSEFVVDPSGNGVRMVSVRRENPLFAPAGDSEPSKIETVVE